MKFIKSILLIFVISLFFSTWFASAAYNSSTASSYLQSHANNPWSTMALSVLNVPGIPTEHLKNINGTKAIDYEAPIIAIAALNQDPKTFGNTDYVTKLKSFYANGQIGDSGTLNDDIFGLIALIAAGLPVNDEIIVATKNYLLLHQNPSGGWGLATGGGSDSNNTAAAIIALKLAGIPGSAAEIQNALNYLKTAQNNDGGFTYDPQSTFGTDSDSDSTAWVLWALNALNIDPGTWSKDGKTPVQFLGSHQAPNGYFYSMSDTSENAFTPITTASAVIALAGKTLPIKIFSGQPAENFKFRIEGSQETVCAGQTMGPTALDIVKNAKNQCGYTYNISQKTWGPYLDQINNDTANGLTGWLFLVNNEYLEVGANDYLLKPQDEVLIFFGEYGWQPTRLTLNPKEILSGQNSLTTVEAKTQSSWTALGNADVNISANSFTTNDTGQVQITGPDGYYKVFAEKSGFIRSNQMLLKIGAPNSGSINLSANISKGQIKGTTTPDSGIAFSVSPNDINFGIISPGASANQQINITNSGANSIHVETVVIGENLFVENLLVNNTSWQKFKTDLIGNTGENQNLKLSVPQNFFEFGTQTGQIIFWATVK